MSLNLSKWWAQTGEVITATKWNQLIAAIQGKFSGGLITAAELAANAVANANLVSPYHWISVPQVIARPGLTANDPDTGTWYGAAGGGAPPNLKTSVFGDGAGAGFVNGLTAYRAPCAMTITQVYSQMMGGLPGPFVDAIQLWRTTPGVGESALAGTLMDAVGTQPAAGDNNLRTGLALDIAEGDILAWRLDLLLATENHLPIHVGFDAKAYHSA